MTFNEFIRLPEKIPCDKRLHYIIGNIFMPLELTLLPLVVVDKLAALVIAMILLILLAWGIEFYQKKTKSDTYDNKDVTFVVIGGVIGAIATTEDKLGNIIW